MALRGVKEITVSPDWAGRRVDAFLASCTETGLTRSAAQRLLANGEVKRGNVILGKNDRLTPGDILTLSVPPPVSCEIKGENIPLDILYEDPDIIVINKPHGMVVHPSAGHFCGTLVNALLYHCRGNLSGIGGVERPGIVHRLDKDTSGVLVAAKNDAAHVSLSAQLAQRTMGRIYYALCLGVVKKEALAVRLPIGRHPVHRQKMAVRNLPLGNPLPPGVRHAVTHIKTLAYLPAHKPRFTFIEAQLETGRTHQIRVHMAHLGHPILGDTLYGPERQPLKTDRHMLHAAKLKLIHPATGEAMVFEAGLPEGFQQGHIKLMQPL
ncbi:MAG: RluA family pseudouridine synthase [Defluviitaleaceae bacterium]|nr:RluA family pseudouridine synthase [Defluviitaleaceae bacterium]MCL2203779.1 RluA family pseudouridine synthase [Defluviitaleaceae bacterium]MCL2239248.1 RluA family pseudouridine synthase [Defluviitaleaceae bacterium]